MSAAVPAPVHGLRLGEHPEPHAVWSLEEAAWIEQRDQQWRLWAESAAPAPAAHPRQLVSVSSIDVERLIAECLPGGSVCDPQAVADNIRRYCNAWPGAAPAAQPLTEAPAELSEKWAYPAGIVDRVGKKAAGRLLDGVQHDGFPEVA